MGVMVNKDLAGRYRDTGGKMAKKTLEERVRLLEVTVRELVHFVMKPVSARIARLEKSARKVVKHDPR